MMSTHILFELVEHAAIWMLAVSVTMIVVHYFLQRVFVAMRAEHGAAMEERHELLAKVDDSLEQASAMNSSAQLIFDALLGVNPREPDNDD